MNSKKIDLNNGYSIPQIGLGTWRVRGTELVEKTLRSAIECGYRHIDTAMVYENEADIGKALQKFYKENLIKREDLFLTSKLWNSYHLRAEEGLKKTLKDLQTDYLDLYLIHWPVTFLIDEEGNTLRDKRGWPQLKPFDLIKVYKKMESFVDSGKIKSIGVSNFGPKNLDLLLKNCRIKPVINQIELHPYFKQLETVGICARNNISITAYSSLGSMEEPGSPVMLEDPIITEIAKKHNRSAAQVILSYLIKKNIIVIPKSVSEKRIKENFDLKPEILTNEDMSKISSIKMECRFVDPDSFGPNRFD